MDNLSDVHQSLVEDYRESMEIAAGKLLAQPGGAVSIGPRPE
ncbi:hypothetical protein [Synechococcus sp. 1G10]|nr:hypothetical protein [Synechococcus sp. 1G10]